MSKKMVIPMEFKSTFIIFVASATLFGGSLLYNLGLIISSAHSSRIFHSGSQEGAEVGGIPLSDGMSSANSESINEGLLTNIFSPDRGMDIPTKWNKTELENVATGDFSDLFKLSGTIYSDDKSWRRAYFLLNSTKKIKGYREGETVTGNIQVVSVRRNSVVLNAGGNLREVRIKPSDLGPTRSPGGVTRTPRSSIGATGESFKVARLSESAFAVDKDSVDYLTENLNKMITKVRIIPYFESGQPAGFRLAAIRPGSTFSKLGFLPGDIIKQVNGILLTSPEKIYTIFQNLRDERKIEIDILRRGRKKTLIYEVR